MESQRANQTVPVAGPKTPIDAATAAGEKRATFATASSFVAPRIHNDDDVQEAARTAYLSGPCECFITIWASLGDAIEGGAQQIVGVGLLALSGAVTYALTNSRDDTRINTSSSAGATTTAEQPPPPPSAPDWSHVLLHASSHFAQIHPIFFVVTLMSLLMVIAVLVAYEEVGAVTSVHSHMIGRRFLSGFIELQIDCPVPHPRLASLP